MCNLVVDKIVLRILGNNPNLEFRAINIPNVSLYDLEDDKLSDESASLNKISTFKLKYIRSQYLTKSFVFKPSIHNKLSYTILYTVRKDTHYSVVSLACKLSTLNRLNTLDDKNLQICYSKLRERYGYLYR